VWKGWDAFDSAKNHKRQRRKRQSVTAKREKSQTPKFVKVRLGQVRLGKISIAVKTFCVCGLSSFGGYGFALAALALEVFGAHDSYRKGLIYEKKKRLEPNSAIGNPVDLQRVYIIKCAGRGRQSVQVDNVRCDLVVRPGASPHGTAYMPPSLPA